MENIQSNIQGEDNMGNKRLSDENLRLQQQLQSLHDHHRQMSMQRHKHNIYNVIIWYGTLGVIWDIVNQLINK